MNEQIRDLAEHCDFYIGNEHYNESHEEKQRLWTKKFAELIVKECEKILIENVEVALDASGNPVSPEDFIKEHFGVE